MKHTLKLLAQPSPSFDAASLIPVFHSFIRKNSLPGTLIDVARYHVENGPLVLLIGHEADYVWDTDRGEPGILVRWKNKDGETPERCLERSAAALREFQKGLETALPGKISFSHERAILTVTDRLVAVNADEDFSQYRKFFEQAGRFLFQDDVSLRKLEEDPRDPLAVELQA